MANKLPIDIKDYPQVNAADIVRLVCRTASCSIAYEIARNMWADYWKEIKNEPR